MLTQALDQLSPVLLSRYGQLLRRGLAASPEYDEFAERNVVYTLLDRNLPRSVLAYFGYHARADEVAFDDVDRVGDGLLIPELFRDYVAVHEGDGIDDSVDDDLERLGQPPLPVVLAYRPGEAPESTRDDQALALCFGGFLLGTLLGVAGAVESPTLGARLPGLVFDTLFMFQYGRLDELLASKPLDQVTVDDLLTVYERKPAYYCYSFPFEVGVQLAGHSPEITDAVRPVLLRASAMSQLVDGLARAFFGGVDYDTDAFSELAHLRRTVLLVLLADHDVSDGVRAQLLAKKPRLSRADAQRIRTELWDSPLPALALRLCDELLSDARPRTSGLPLGNAAKAYLDDLIQHLLERSVARLRTVLRSSGQETILWSPATGSR